MRKPRPAISFCDHRPQRILTHRDVQERNFESGGSARRGRRWQMPRRRRRYKAAKSQTFSQRVEDNAFHLDASSPVAHAPDGLIAVFADKQAAIFRDGDSDRATPDFAIGRDEAGHEVFVFAARFAG